MENQGKRKDQIESSEQITLLSLVGIIILLVILGFYKFLTT